MMQLIAYNLHIVICTELCEKMYVSRMYVENGGGGVGGFSIILTTYGKLTQKEAQPQGPSCTQNALPAFGWFHFPKSLTYIWFLLYFYTVLW